MSVQITIDDRAAIAMLDRLRASGANMAAVHDEIGVAFEQQIKLAFDDQRDPWGQAWAALSPVTGQCGCRFNICSAMKSDTS